MKKHYFFICLLLLIISCQKDGDLSIIGHSNLSNDSLNIKNSSSTNKLIDLDDSKNYDDLYNLSVFEKLKKDDSYREYMNQFIESNINVRLKYLEAEKTVGQSISLDDPSPETASEQSDAIFDIRDMAKSMIVDGVKLGVEGYKLNELDNKRKKLYNSFSVEKKTIAQEFEAIVLNIINESYNLPVNTNLSKNAKYKNYRSISKILATDNEVKKHINNVADLTDNCLLKAFRLREKLYLNEKLGNKNSINLISSLTTEILINPEIEFDTNSIIVTEYFESLKNLSKTLSAQNFKVPTEDWSEERKNNFDFIISDVKNKINNVFTISSESKSIIANGKKSEQNQSDIAINFINSYIKFLDQNIGNQRKINDWVLKNNVLSDEFKTSFKQLIKSDLDGDPIINGQDFPSRFILTNYNSKTNSIIVEGKDWPDFKLTLRLTNESGIWLINSCGIVNNK